MGYRVFLVEDEIVTREGIRDNVDWKSAGCEFCGEASDGETALSLIETSKPDILITDIKMPFMDGLQLSRIVRKHKPRIKIIILSGHDEFEYAQSALKIGVTEYLLKPASSEDILNSINRITLLLDEETKERTTYEHLREDAQDNLATLRGNFLLRLVMGGVSSAEAIERGQQLGLEIIAPWYQVLLLKINLCDGHMLFDYQVYEKVEQIIKELVGPDPEILYTRNGLDEFVFIIAGENSDQLREVKEFWARLIEGKIADSKICDVIIKTGAPQQRLGEIHHSFAEALIAVKNASEPLLINDTSRNTEHVKLLKSERSALEDYLKFGDLLNYEEFISSYLEKVKIAAMQSVLVRNYLLVDISLTITQFLNDLDPGGEHEPPQIKDLEKLLESGEDFDQTCEVLKKIISNAVQIRDDNLVHERVNLIRKAKNYIDKNFVDPDLKMNKVAAIFNLSSGYFSTIFSQEIGESYRNYLNGLRINQAKELLKTTNMKITEVAHQCGYNDAHYFSTMFKKITGFTPSEIREDRKKNRNRE